MKLSKMRKKARSAFKKPRNIRYRGDDGRLFMLPDPCTGVTVPVVVVRGRQFTKPQCAVQRDR